jgi:Glutamyl-tRNAGlu reductase, dimerisation domain
MPGRFHWFVWLDPQATCIGLRKLTQEFGRNRALERREPVRDADEKGTFNTADAMVSALQSGGTATFRVFGDAVVPGPEQLVRDSMTEIANEETTVELEPVLNGLREKWQDIARAELLRHRRRLGVLTPEQESAIEALVFAATEEISVRFYRGVSNFSDREQIGFLSLWLGSREVAP